MILNSINAALNIIGDFTSGARIVLTDLSGKVVISQDIRGINNSLDVSTLEKGLYFISGYLSGQEIYSKWVVNL